MYKKLNSLQINRKEVFLMMWKDSYKVGVELIDNQHKELFRRLSEFFKVIRGDGSWEDRMAKVKETLEFMQEYVIIHFHDEETYQEEIGFPDLENHKFIHEKFKKEISDCAKTFEAGEMDEDKMQEFGGKLMTWLIMHVGKADQQIGEYARAKEGQA